MPNEQRPCRYTSLPALPRVKRGSKRRGFTILELEVAMVVFGVAVMGVCPLTVMYTKQLKNLQARFSPQTTYYLVPSSDAWTRKLGAAASLTTQNPGAAQPPQSPTPVNDVQIQSLDRTITGEVVTVWVSVQAIGP